MAATLTQLGNPGRFLRYRAAPHGNVAPVLDMAQVSSSSAPAPVVYATPTVRDDQVGFKIYTVTLGTYATGGVAIAATDAQMATIIHMIAHPAGGRMYEWDNVNGKMKAYQCSAGAAAFTEVPNATDLSGTTLHVLVLGLPA